ncbi:hypothetical protein CYY_007872 [Polysphondylium violaceum]|uniref:Complex 1 LYR protein domain-containing protein n=1 Tax=Polysphondylium violaceum TaxID=133409 RepID=A0A8J4PR90_9MYCE|nr:hypothetical protein CYY_007872 [Polysphondylium violaceum]
MNSTTSIARHSGLQKEILSLYRKFLRQSIIKDKSNAGDSSSSSLQTYIQSTFRARAQSIPKRDISRIEFLVLQGKRQLETLGDQNSTGFTVFTPKN